MDQTSGVLLIYKNNKEETGSRSSRIEMHGQFKGLERNSVRKGVRVIENEKLQNCNRKTFAQETQQYDHARIC